ncbi:MAG TPA: pre-peptidase C-terminal domain-containing protein [Tepidisphaeraceae bacterium]|jgi:hypothetical protein|nr:pre-peptidase C-terminal domain-containing protein [Tepidisphaeraceae bacterium]
MKATNIRVGPGLTGIALTGFMLILAFAGATRAASPTLSQILPRGVQRGTDAELVINGAHLDDAKEVFFYTPGVAVTGLEAKSPSELHVHVTVAKDARLGEYQVRVRTESGISDLRTLYVGAYPIVPFKEGKPDKRGRVYYDFEHPQQIDLNTTIAGSIATEQVQYFAVDMKKGQRLTAEVHGMRLGDMFDPYVAILDEKKFELSVSDDTALAMQDPIASAVIPADGRYIILLRESSYGAGSHYLMHVGSYPRPRVVYPLGGRPGEDLHFQYLGDAAGPISQTLKLPAKAVDSFDVFPEQDGLIAPSPNHLRVSDMPNVLEKEPNDDFNTATVYDGELPVAFNGIIQKEGDVDFFKFKAKRGAQLDVRVYARQLRSPLDSVLSIHNAKGGVMASNDDSGGPDSYIRFGVPNDGEYAISITDQLHQGGPEYAYRVEITDVKTDLVFAIPQFAQNSQERWTIPVPRGNRYATMVRATRVNAAGDATLSIPALPDGVTMQSVDGSGQEILCLFEAKADAAIGGKLCDVGGTLINGEKKVDVTPRYEQEIGLVYGNNQPVYQTLVNSLAVAVTKESPFKLHLEQPKVPLVQGGETELKVTAERAADFKSPITIRLVLTPPNLNAISTVEMPGDKNEVAYPINAQMNAALKTWKVCVVGMSDVNGQLWVASELVDLTIAEPYLLAQLHMAAVEQGQSGAMLCKFEQKQPFEGKAKVKLMGLPANTSAEDVEITASDKQVVFPITVGEKAAPGPHGGVFCRVTVMKDGNEIVHNLGRDVVLRVDKPVAPKSSDPAPAAVKVAAKPKIDQTKVLSRLEKLREEQGQK